jgi:hypothetical protein
LTNKKENEEMKYERKTVDFYKMEIFVDGKWVTVFDSDNVYEYKNLLNILYLTPFVKHKGKKYRKIKEVAKGE